MAVTYYIGELGKGGVKTVSESLKNEQLVDGVEYIGSGESEAGYIHKLYAPEQGYYFYIVIGKIKKLRIMLLQVYYKQQKNIAQRVI